MPPADGGISLIRILLVLPLERLTAMLTTQNAIDELQRLYSTYGSHSYDEAMSQLQHAVQAARLAEAEGYDPEVVLAAFFHDVGHLLVEEVPVQERDSAIYRHQQVGADYLLLLGFSHRVARLVREHVAGKRYLVAVDPDYLATLSEASVRSLDFQGGPMSYEEVCAFESDPDRELFVQLRRWDDRAKNPQDQNIDCSKYMEMAREHLEEMEEVRQL